MFRELVTADIVIADISIHNANVFYELGIRHGLRPNATFLLRADVDKVPFDLQTDRYLKYPAARPEEALDALVAALEATLAAARIDSPVYMLLPALRAPDPAALRVVPQAFGEAVQRASAADAAGDLRLLACESRGTVWASEGLRAVGRAQFALQRLRDATETFEWLRGLHPDDVEANQRLATTYQRMAAAGPDREDLLSRSTAAIQRVIESPLQASRDLAEAYALKARNIKARWVSAFDRRTGGEAQRAALRAAELEESLDCYAAGFAHDLNHFYSGLNALALLRIRVDLAHLHPETWASFFDTDANAREELELANRRLEQLAGAVHVSIEGSRCALARQSNPDVEKRLWTDISAADLAFLTAARPAAVAQAYRRVLSTAPRFAVTAVRDQIALFDRLQVRPAFVADALAVLAELEGTHPRVDAVASADRVLLFTGHMIDASTQSEPRFPPTPEAEREARRLIREAVSSARAGASSKVVGLAGGACGGDILFHEVCGELEIPTQVYLPFAKDAFCRASVQHGGREWVRRFHALCERVPPHVLCDAPQLPSWLRSRNDYSVWQRGNLWMLFSALALDPRPTLIALWDGSAAHGSGGTRDLVEHARTRGLTVDTLPAERLKHCTAI